jgi:hypothetical protein
MPHPSVLMRRALLWRLETELVARSKIISPSCVVWPALAFALFQSCRLPFIAGSASFPIIVCASRREVGA